jgi:hypothetical protein
MHQSRVARLIIAPLVLMALRSQMLFCSKCDDDTAFGYAIPSLCPPAVALPCRMSSRPELRREAGPMADCCRNAVWYALHGASVPAGKADLQKNKTADLDQSYRYFLYTRSKSSLQFVSQHTIISRSSYANVAMHGQPYSIRVSCISRSRPHEDPT